MTVKKQMSALFVALTLASPIAFAQDKSAGSGPNPFTDCGIGAALFPDTKWAAVTSNVIWDIGTTAVISATASPQTCSGKKVAALAFVGKTHEKLAEEASRGSGEHIASALNLMECKADKHAVATQSIRAGMAAVVAAPNYANQDRMQRAAGVFNVVERAVNTHCAA
jgi:hypothetical protein